MPKTKSHRTQSLSRARLLRELADADRQTREDRLRRYRFLQAEFGGEQCGLFVGGLFAARAYQEAQGCYLNACFVGCVVLCQIMLEHSLAGAFAMSGREDLSGAGFFRLVREAQACGWLTDEEAAAFHEVRQIRNDYTHGADGGIKWALTRAKGHEDEFAALEHDAEVALRTMHRMMKRGDDASEPASTRVPR